MAIERIILVVLDGVGIGELPDAAGYGDVGSHTLGHTAAAVGGLELPFFAGLGLGKLASIQGVPQATSINGAYGKMAEASVGKDTVTGHWEMMGVVSTKPFPTYPHGFPPEIIQAFENAIGRKTIGNTVASGTVIIQELGEEHYKTGSPIVYTSADSVFQIAAHEGIISLEEQYRICSIARELLRGEHQVARVIARPFEGEPGNFHRTPNRKDYAVDPPTTTALDILKEQGWPVFGIGKIEDIFNHRGLTGSNHTHNNPETLAVLKTMAQEPGSGLIFANCVDFDMVYGHRNDTQGFAQALREADHELQAVSAMLREEDLLVVTADHGCDPGFPGTDHTREYTPLLIDGPVIKGSVDLGIRGSFADLGATVLELLTGKPGYVGKSFAQMLK